MKNQDHSEEDLIRRYFNPAMITKAPGGFTGKTFARIELEKQKSNPMMDYWHSKKVPVISGIVIFLLITAGLMFPEEQSGGFVSTIMDYVSSIDLSFSALQMLKFHELPGWLIYSVMGIVLMIIADLVFALSSEEGHR